MKRKGKKELFSVLLILILVGITIGFAALSTNLDINGTSKISSNSWDIHFENVVVTSGSVLTPSPNQAATINPSNTTEVTYIVTLEKPGDFYEFTVDAVNAGTVDGMIGSVVSKLNGVVIDQEHPLPVYLDYSVTYEDDIVIENNHLLEAGKTETYKIRLEFKKDISNDQLPSGDINSSLSFGTNYLQKNENAVKRQHAYVYSVMGATLGESVPNNLVTYQTYQELVAAENCFVFLRYVIVDDIVENADVGLLYNDNVYYFDVYDEEDLSLYETNKTEANNIFGSENCIDEGYRYHCSITGPRGPWVLMTDSTFSAGDLILFCDGDGFHYSCSGDY